MRLRGQAKWAYSWNIFVFYTYTTTYILEDFSLVENKTNADIDQGVHKVKLKNARNEKRKKLYGFSYT